MQGAVRSQGHGSGGHGIVTVDTGFHRPAFDAAYLVVEAGRAAFVDCGTSHSVPAMLDALRAQGLSPDAVDWLVLTHVHLDHAGGAGLLMEHLPRARLAVHPRGAPHMIDPARLIAGATQVYGAAEIERSYGRILPIAAERVVVVEDGQDIKLAGRTLHCIDTPGHARHHMCIWDARSRGWFTGDTFGLSYREFDTGRGAFVLPTTSPVQFEPEPLKASIRRMLSFDPAAMYLTHYGPVTDVQRLGHELVGMIDATVAAGLALRAVPERHVALVERLTRVYLDAARAHGVTADDAALLEVLGMDIELNAQGLAVWLDRLPAAAGVGG